MEIAVFCAGAAKHAVTGLAKEFEILTGYKVNLTSAPVGLLKEKLENDEAADVAFLTINALLQLPQILATSITEIGKVGVGIAVKHGDTKPDISTAAALRQTLLAAPSLAYADPAKGATSGIHFESVLEILDIADIVKQKSYRLGGFVAEEVAGGKAALCIQQITEIIPIAGVTLVGPLPPELQKITAYGAGITATAAQPDMAAAFIRFITNPQAKEILRNSGFDVV